MTGFTPNRRNVLRAAGTGFVGLSLASTETTADDNNGSTETTETPPTCVRSRPQPATDTAAKPTSTSTTADADVHEEFIISMHPGIPETAWVSLSTDASTATDEFRYLLSDSVEVIAQTGFDRDEDYLEWDGTEEPTVVYMAESLSGWGIGDDWALADATSLTLKLQTDGPDATADRSIGFLDSGYHHPDALSSSVLVAPNATASRTIAGETVTYVRPDREFAPAAPSMEAYFEVIETTAEMLNLDDPNPSIGYIVNSVTGPVTGRAIKGMGDGVPDFVASDSTRRTIAHEYVHNQQSYWEASDYIWANEGLATFFERCLGYRLGYSGLRPTSYDMVDPLLGSTDRTVIYQKGAAMCFLLDLELRERSDGAVDMSNILRALNGYEDPNQFGSTIIGHEEFKAIVADVLGEELDAWLDERIVEPYEIEFPPDLEGHYPGPDAPRPDVPLPGERDLLIHFEANTTDKAPDEIVLSVEAQTPDVLRLDDVDVMADEDFYDLVVDLNDDQTTAQITVDLIEHDFFELLTDTPFISIDTEPRRCGGAFVRVTGHVTYRDGSQEAFAPGVGGRRTTVEPPAPEVPSVSPTVIPVDEPIELSVTDPDPALDYLWDFAGDGRAEAIGPKATHTFESIGDTSIDVSAVNRKFNRTTSSISVAVTEDGTRTVSDYTDEDGIVQPPGVLEAIDDWREDGIDSPLVLDVIEAWRSGEPVE